MNFKFSKIKFLLATLILTGVIVSCSKEEEKNTELTPKEVKEIISSSQFLNSFLFQENLTKNKLAKRGKSDGGDCDVLKILKIKEGKFIYNFDSGCTFLGKTYSGKLEIEYEPKGYGYTRTLKYENFVSDGFKISGISKYDVTFKDKKGHLLVGVTSDLVITKKDGTTFSRIGKIQLEKVAGNKTLKLADDVYEISGGWESMGFDGVNRSIKISKNLKRKSISECAHTTEGTIIIEKGSKKHTVDFGNGECDSKVTLNGKELSL